MTTTDRIAVLEQQQALLTDGLAKMLTNEWVGFPSLEADLLGLDPNLQLDPHPPVPESAQPPPRPSWWTTFQGNRDLYMAPQAYGWTCSVCSTTWVLQATGLQPSSGDIYSDRENVAYQIGYPNCVNSYNGCESIECIVRVFEEHGVVARNFWVTFDQAYAIAGLTTGVINPIGMYHFMAIRGRSGSDLWVANSAESYDGVWSTLSRSQFNALGPVQVAVLDPRY